MQISETPVYGFGPFRLDPAERRLLLGGEPLPLAPKVLDTLVALVEADGRLVTKEALIQRLWPDTIVDEVNLARNVSLLRKVLGDQDNGRKYIETVSKSGYRFTGPVSKVARPVGLHNPRGADIAPGAPAFTPSARGRASWLLASVVVACLVAIAAGRGGLFSPPSVESALPEPAYVRATFDGNVVESALSPDGTLVASVLRGPPMRLVLRDIATGSTIEALRDEFVFHPKWSPDGSTVAALRSKIGRDGYLAIAPRLGGPPARLRGGFGAWSPDGKRVAVTYGSQRGFSVFGLDGLLLQEVRLSGFDWMIDLEWSRASDRLLLWTENAQRHTILWSVSSDGAEVRQLYAPKTRLLGAAWSPDGSAIYVLRPVAEDAELVRVPLAWRSESDEQVLIRGLTAARGFSLSADGSKLLFKRVTSVANLWRVTVGDSTHEAAVETAQLTRGASRMLSPVIAPDGRSVAFVRAEANGAVIQRSGLPIEEPVETLSAVD
jgi:DNA-binding winged helix-turn-helix (wHTH) protein/Tol biopolymer transport system component